MKISVMFPVYLPTREHRDMTDKVIYLAKTRTKAHLEWVIVETCSNYYRDEADVYIHEKERTTPNASMNAGFKACSGDYVIFLSNDVVVCENWVDLLTDCFTQHDDCGIASLGNNEHGDIPRDEIKEQMYFAVCMLRKEDAWYDSNYKRVWDDTDLVMRLHAMGKKFYKNLNGLVYHKTHSTMGEYAGDRAEYDRCQEYFIKKYQGFSSDPMFRKLAYGR
jgi:glycosyltransferase involved in cell wall biosynthesis